MANELQIIALECKLFLVKFDVPLPASIQEGLKVSVVVFICLTLCLTSNQYIISNFEDPFQSFQAFVKFYLKNGAGVIPNGILWRRNRPQGV